MILDPNTGDLFTDKGRFLKRMSCPKRTQWSETKDIGNPGARHCENCDRLVHDTAQMKDSELRKLLKKQPDACLKISLRQPNVSLLRPKDIEL